MSPRHHRIALFALIALGVIDRAVLLFTFGFRYTGSDDVVFWQAARDYAHGIFHEPYMYGQDYNPMLESLLAVPGVWLGVPYAILLPLVTSLLALLPFWSFAWWHHRRGDQAAALLLAAMPLLLPVEHAMLTTLTRGFVTGIAVLALFPWTTDIARNSYRCLAGGAVLGFSVFFNPSAAVLAVPLGIHMLLIGRRYLPSIAWMIAGASPVVLLWLVFRQSYLDHPERVLHQLYDWRMVFHAELIPEHFDHLGEHFAWLCPVFWKHGEVVLILVAAICLLLFVRKRSLPAFTLLSALLVVVASFAYAKTQDGSMSVLLPLSRMYLAMPLLLGWSIALAWPRASLPPVVVRIGVLITAGSMLVRLLHVPGAIERVVREQAHSPVGELAVADLRADAIALAGLAKRTGAELVVWSRLPKSHEALTGCYASELLQPALPPSLLIGDDRRYWRVEHERTNIASVVLFVGGDPEAWRRNTGAVELLGTLPASNIDVHVLRNNTLPVLRLVEALGIEP